MASLVGGIAGAVIGGFVTGWSPQGIAIGWSIGAGVGAYLGQPNIEGPRLQDRNVPVSSYGAAINTYYGSVRVPTNFMWPLNFQVDEHQSGGGKGGGSPKTYTYSATFAVLVGGPCQAMPRIWMNKKLVYDVNASPSTDPCISGMRMYYGTETQTPDSLMVARDGSAPAYRGYSYIVFDSVELTNSGFGSRPPQVEVEVFENVGGAPVITSHPVIYNTQFGVANGNGITIVSLSDDPYSFAISNNGGAWTYVTSSIGSVWGGAPNHVFGGAFGASTFVFQNAYSVITSIDNGVTWTNTLNTSSGPWTISSVDFVNGLFFILFNSHASVVTSPDGVTWTYRSTPFSGAARVAWNGAVYCAIGMGGNVCYTSPDLITWTSHAVPVGNLIRLAALGSLFVCLDSAGSSTYITSSDNGVTWTSRTMPIVGYFDLRSNGSELCAASGADVYISTDGINWVHGTDAAGSTFWAMTVGGDSKFRFTGGSTGTPSYNVYTVDNLVLGNGQLLSTIVSDICTRAPFGLLTSDIDVTQLTDTVDGYLLQQQMTRRSAIEPLQASYFFDVVEVDHVLKFVKRGRASDVTVPEADRGAVVYGNAMTPPLQITRIPELELPWMIDVSYMDKTRDYQVADQYDRRVTRNSNNPVSMSMPIVMTATKAKQVAVANLYLAWSRETFTFETTVQYAKYTPTDVFTLPTASATYTARITSRKDVGNGIIHWEAKLEDATVYAQAANVPAVAFIPQAIRNPGVTTLELLDMPILRDTDNDPGFYTAVAGNTTGWRGAQLYESADSGTTYVLKQSFTLGSTIGAAQGVLGNFTAGNIVDNGSSVTVLMSSGTLVNATLDQVLSGVNIAVIGANGRWEVIGFTTATLIAANTYTLTGLLRGRRGTEWATGTHAIGDTFVLADITTWQRLNNGSGELGLARLFKAPAIDTTLAAAVAQTFTDTGIGLKPYSPVDMTGTRDGSNNLTIGWHRRSRLGYGTLNALVPLGESTESYSIDIMSGVTVLRTLTSSSPSVAYSAANQTTDGITPGNPVTASVYQLSSVVGRGYPLKATV